MKAQIPLPDSEPSLSDYSLDSDAELDSDLLTGNGESVAEDSGSSNGDDEDKSDLKSGLDAKYATANVEEESGPPERRKRRHTEVEAEYEVSGRSRWTAAPLKSDTNIVEIARLPIKLQNGEVQQMEGRITVSSQQAGKEVPMLASESDEEELTDDEQEGSDDGAHAEKMASQRGKFGRIGVAEIVGEQRWNNSQRLEAAKEQIAAIGAEILAGGELADTVACQLVSRIRADVEHDSRLHCLPDCQPLPCLRSLLWKKKETICLFPPRSEASESSPSLQFTKISFRAIEYVN